MAKMQEREKQQEIKRQRERNEREIPVIEILRSRDGNCRFEHTENERERE